MLSYKGHMLDMQRSKKKSEQEFVVGKKVLENILSLHSQQNTLSRAISLLLLFKTLCNEIPEVVCFFFFN